MSGTVVIVGGGPAGLMLGCELRLGGIETIILEQRREAPAASGGMAVHGQTMKVLKERGFAERIHGEGIFPWPRTPFALLWLDISSAKPEELTYVYPQWRLERLLESRAVELGVDLRRGHRVIGVEQDAAGVTARVAAGDEVYQLTGDYLVGCDGPDSAVRKAAGITSAVLGNSYYGVWGDLELTPGTDYPFESGVYDRGIFGAMPLVTGGLRLMSIEFDETGPTEEPVTEQELFESMRRITGGAPTTGKISHLGRFGGPVSIADRYR
ncbi:FAD-dependent monooxygenase, partial [Frankia sp. ACN1ag]